MTPEELLAKIDADKAQDEKRSKDLANELNEKLGVIPHKYVAMFRIPEEPWRAGAIWDRGYFDVAKHVITAIVIGIWFTVCMESRACIYSATTSNCSLNTSCYIRVG